MSVGVFGVTIPACTLGIFWSLHSAGIGTALRCYIEALVLWYVQAKRHMVLLVVQHLSGGVYRHCDFFERLRHQAASGL